MRVQPFPFVGGAYRDEDRPWSIQDTVNFLPVLAEKPGTRSQAMLKTPPGLKPFCEVVDARSVRGTYNAEGRFFAVVDQTLYQILPDASATPLGQIPGLGRVTFTHNQISLGNQIVIANGSAGYVYDTVLGTLERITDPGFPGTYVLAFIDSYVLGIDPQGRFAFNSSPADAKNYNTLDRFTSEVRPDRLVSLAVINNELMLLSATSCEFFDNTGALQQPFRSKRISLDKGCAGPWCAVEIDNSVCWLGSDGVIYRLNGYSPVRISTLPIEQAIRGLNWSQAFAFVWIDSGHTVAYWTFPDGQTWGYDASQNEWHRRESITLSRWRVSSMTRWNNRWYAGDFNTGRVWELDWNYVLEGDQEFVSERTIGIFHDDQNLVRAARLELVMDTGMQETVAIPFPSISTVVSFVGPDGNGGLDGRFTIRLADDLYTAGIEAAFESATSVVITGLSKSLDDLSGEGGADFPGANFDTVSLEMTYDEDFVMWKWTNDDSVDQSAWYWARIEIDGVFYIGAVYMGVGI